jgi:hypothetical protein
MPSPSKEREPEQEFFADPAIDRLMGFVYALSAEVYVLRDRLARLEGTLISAGALKPGATEAFQRTPEQMAEAALDRQSFVAALMENIMARQVSKGAAPGIEHGAKS